MPQRVYQPGKSIAAVCGIVLLATGLSACNRDESPQALIAEAKTFQQKGDHKAALIQLKNGVAKNSGDASLRIMLAGAYLDNFEPVNAEKEYRKALELGAKPDQVLLGLAKSLHGQGQYKKVLDATEESVGKNDPDIALMRADALLALDRIDEAGEGYSAVLKARPDGAEALNGMARYYFSKGDMAEAQKASDAAIARHPNDTESLMLRARLLQGQVQGQHEAALAVYDKVLALNPAHRTAHLEKAYLDIRARKFDAAQRDIEAAKKANPDNLLWLYAQASLEHEQGKFGAAREAAQKLLAVAPDHMPTVLLLAVAEMKQGAFEQSQRNARKYVEAHPQHPFARNLLIMTLLKTGLTVDAIGNVTTALRDQKPNATLYGLAGQAYLQAGDYNKASEFFEKASQIAPDAAGYRTMLGMSRLGQGDVENGMRALEQATNLGADSLQAAMTLVSAQLQMRQYDKALATVATLEKKHPDDANIVNMRGVAFAGKKDMANAKASFEKALAMQPNYLAAAGNLAQMHVKDGKMDAAKGVFEDFLKKNKGNPGAMGALANLEMSQGRKAESMAWLKRAHAENPEHLDTAMRLGHALGQDAKPQEALPMLRKFLTTNPTNTELLDLIGLTQVALKDGPGAVETFGKLAALLPRSGIVQFRLASAQAMSGNENAAAASLKRALALQPNLKEAMLATAELALRKGNFDQATVLAMQLQKQHPKDPVGLVLEGNLLTAQKKPAEALRVYEKAYAMAPTGPNLIKVHNALLQAGQEKQAEARTDQWLAKHPGDVQMEMYLAESLLARKLFPAAIARFEKLVAANGKNAIALNNLAWAYQQQKDPRALATAEKAFQLAGGSPNVLDTYGWMLVEQGQAARGVELLKKAASIAPPSPELRMHLAVGMIKAGDSPGARRELEQLVAQDKRPALAEQARQLLKQM